MAHASEGGHWYDRRGNPVYEIRGANGNMRPATLRDARKLGLLPGFSGIAACEAKPQLERWKIMQALMAAITLPRNPGESDDAFLDRALEDSKQQAIKAAQRGTYIHSLIQGTFEGRPYPLEEAPTVEAVRWQIAMNFSSCEGWTAELSFAHELGYGGKADLSRIDAVLDVKGKDFDTTSDLTKLAWPEHAMQLAAYREGLGTPTARCANLFFSRSVPGLVVVHEWTQSELQLGWEAFMLLQRLWCIRRNYNPSFDAALEAA